MSKSTKRDQQMQIKCHALAFLFSQDIREAKELARRLNTSDKQVRNWHARKEFHEALDTLGYEGDRTFTRKRRDVARENPTAYKTACLMYQQLEDEGVPERQRIREVADRLGGQYSVQRINNWVKRYKEEGGDTEE